MPPKKPTTTEAALRQPPRRFISGADKITLKAYNAGQPLRSDGVALPYKEEAPKPTLRSVMSQGRFQLDTRNGVIAARGAGPTGGSGGPDDVETVGLAAKPQWQPVPPPAPPPAPASVQKSVRQSLTQQPQARQAMSMNLRAPGEVGSAGVMTQQARLRGMTEASQLNLPPATRQAVEAQVLAGDVGAPGRAAQALASLPPGALAPGREMTIDRQLAAHVVAGGAPVAEKKAADKLRYQEASLRNTAKAQAGSAQALELGLDPLAQPGQVQQALRQAMSASSASALQPLAAQGNMAAADALVGTPGPGPWAQQGVLGREAQNQKDLYDLRYVQPAQARADGLKTVAELKQAGYHDRDLVNLQMAQLKQQTEVFKAQLIAANLPAKQQAEMLNRYISANGRVASMGLDLIPWSQFMPPQAANSLPTPVQIPPPAGLPGIQNPGTQPQQPGAMGAGPTGGQDQAAHPYTPEQVKGLPKAAVDSLRQVAHSNQPDAPMAQAILKQWYTATGGRAVDE